MESHHNVQRYQYEVTKTFAWHGFYGGLTDIKDVEVGFCKGVSDSITGKD